MSSISLRSVPPELDLREVRGALMRAVRRACPPWMRGEAEDIVQQALIRLHEKHRQGELPAEPAPSYLWRVAHNAMIDALRSRARRTGREHAYHQGREHAPEEPDDALHLHQLAAGVHDCLQRLNEDRRAVVAMHLEGHGPAEIDGILRWGHKRIRNLVFRGMDQLRRCLEHKGLRA